MREYTKCLRACESILVSLYSVSIARWKEQELKDGWVLFKSKVAKEEERGMEDVWSLNED